VLSHQPIDVVVVMLGGNDLKPGYQRSPAEIADGLAGYVDDLATHVRDRNGRVPATILVGPTAVDDTAPMFRDLVGENFDSRHAARSHELSTEIRRVAERVDVLYADPSTAAGPGIDGLHLRMEAHAGLAGLIAGLVRRET
jgi:lysophospholipase L1-like esterase